MDWKSRRRARLRRGLVLPAALALVAAGLAVVTAAPAQAATTITIDGNGTGRELYGVGAVSGGGGNSRFLFDYPEPQRSEILDYLFHPSKGAAVQLLKVEVGGDTNSTSGAEKSHEHTRGAIDCNRGYEWWLMEQAKSRNPNIRFSALAWGAPGWVGNGNFWSTDMINYYISWLNCAKSRGLTIDSIGGWNERPHNKSWFINFKNALVANGYGNVKTVANDASQDWYVADDVVSDANFARAVDIIGVHYICKYRSDQSNCPSTPNALRSGKVLWASENGSDDYNAGAQALARGINRGYIDGKATAYINWPLIAAVTPNLPFATMGVAYAPQPWSGWYSIGKNTWAMAHTTQFTAPGWHYIDSASGYLGGNRTNGSYVTLKSTNNTDYSTVIETMDATASQTFTATVTGGLSTGTVRVWDTNLTSNNPSSYLVRGADITPSGGRFSLTLQPGHIYTLTTTTGGGKGSATSPAQGVMPLPHTDDFDGYNVGAEAKYLQDQQGAFEITACGAGRPGKCVRQMAAQAPINWAIRSTPYALIGDLAWRNYTVSTDLLLERPGSAELLGRAGTQKRFTPAAINAYYLRVSDTGAWSLQENNDDGNGTRTTLASGTVSALGTNRWHTLGLTFSGSTISAVIDGQTVRTITDTSYATGMAGLGTSEGQTAQFDNLSITTGAPSPGGGPVSGATYKIKNVAMDRYLDSESNGALTLGSASTYDDQDWILTQQPNGAWTIRNVRTGRYYLDTDPNNVVVWNSGSIVSDSQWRVEPTSGGFRLDNETVDRSYLYGTSTGAVRWNTGSADDSTVWALERK